FHSFNLNGFPLRERSGRCRNSASPFNLKSETLFKLKDYITVYIELVIVKARSVCLLSVFIPFADENRF
ncbi:MAG: hypothetical protein LBC86_07235, partial [Oscillospiraceae bacterium]|nr:hypothetical protein [Oscillospiraceae bacterium]